MFNLENDWNPKYEKLKSIIEKPEYINESIRLAIELHSIVHSSKIRKSSIPTYPDKLLDGLIDEEYSIMLNPKGGTIAWSIWHITRIEDITINILVNNSKQVFNDEWQKKLNAGMTDTGNAMTDEEIILLSKNLNKEVLLNYRNAVGRQTQEIIENLTKEDMKRNMLEISLNRIFDEGGVTKHPDSMRLLNFWGTKDVLGILLMPITRHQIIHWNEIADIKKKII